MPSAEPSLDTIFCEAIAIADPIARAAFTKRSCGSNVELYQQVEALVAAHFQAGSFLDQPVNTVDIATRAASAGYAPLTTKGSGPAPCILPKACPPTTSATVSSSFMAMRPNVSRMSRPEPMGSGLAFGPSGLT